MNADRLVLDISSRQGGVIRIDQALSSGMTRDQVRQRLRTGQWTSLIRGSYLVAEISSLDDRLRAAVAALPGAVVSHEAAAEIHDLSYVERGLATVLVHSQTTHDFPGVIVRRCHDLENDHVEICNGLPTTTAARTIVDLASLLSKRNTEVVLDDAVAAGGTTIAMVRDVLTAVGRRGRPGTVKLRDLLDERDGVPLRGTPLERLGNKLLIDGPFPEPEFEYALPWDPSRRFDAAFPRHRLAIEWDSRRWHMQAAAFQRDRDRDRQAIVNGWRVLRFTWSDLTEHPEEVIRCVQRALEQQPSVL